VTRHDNYNDQTKLLDAEGDGSYLTQLEGRRLLGDEAEREMELDDLTATLQQEGIDVSPEGDLPSQRRQKLRPLDDSEDVDFTPSENPLDKTSDPVRLYLREMGAVPLLNRQGEIEIAKRFERGHLRVLKSISRSPIVIQEVLAIGAEIEGGRLSIRDFVIFDEEELTDDIVVARARATVL